ncbi:MAG: hypothetical protein QM758_13155 [Armatimonas sp.]
MSAALLPYRFNLGTIHLSVAAFEALVRNEAGLVELLQRHRTGDFGEMPYDDKQVNEKSIRQGGRILSSYPLEDGTVIWIITGAGWTTTSVMVREEY